MFSVHVNYNRYHALRDRAALAPDPGTACLHIDLDKRIPDVALLERGEAVDLRRREAWFQQRQEKSGSSLT